MAQSLGSFQSSLGAVRIETTDLEAQFSGLKLILMWATPAPQGLGDSGESGAWDRGKTNEQEVGDVV